MSMPSVMNGFHWFINQPIWPILVVILVAGVTAEGFRRHDERIRKEERRAVTRQLDPERADEEERAERAWAEYHQSERYKALEREARARWKAERKVRSQSSRERYRAKQADVRSRCASGIHRPYHPTVMGRKLTKCLDCEDRLPDDYQVTAETK
jgi:hypothetical protein